MSPTPAHLRLLLAVAALLGLLPCPALAQFRFVSVVPAAANLAFPDEDGDHPAYIEIRSLETGILSGQFLADHPGASNPWQVPAGYALAPGQTLRIFASGKDRRPAGPDGVLHTSFTYDCSVPYCGLLDSKRAVVDTFADRADRCACDGVQVLGPKAVTRVLIPVEDPGPYWNLPGFDDSGWIRGVTGVGYENGSSPYQAGLVLYHTLDKPDVNGTVVQDVSGPLLHPGGVTGSLPMVSGRIGQGLDFKGTSSSHIRVPHHPELDPGTGSFTVALWFKPARGTQATTGAVFTEYLLSKLAPSSATEQGGRGWSIHRTQAGTFVRAVTALGPKTVDLGVTASGQWNHVVWVVNRAAGQAVGYLNGKRMGQVPLGSPSAEPIASNADLLEGRDPGGTAPYAGALDDVALWNRSMSDSQVAELFSVGQQGRSFLDGTAFPSSGQLFTGLIGTDVLPRMKGIHTSAFIRVPFQLPSLPALASGLRLRVHYTDGFVAYLNGAEVARRNAPSVVDHLAAAPVDRPDAAALAAETIDLGAFSGLLKPGGNLLAFHGLSHHADADRFLIAPVQLCLQVERNPPQGGDCIRQTNGREFWVAFPQNYTEEPDTPLRLSLCIAGTPKTQGVVEIPGLVVPGFPRAFSLPPAGTLVIDVPRAAELAGTDVIEPKGVHILASSDVAVYGTTRMDFTTDTYLALPTRCLGTEYLVCTYRNVFSGIPILNGTQFAIVAVANGTEVTLVPPGPVAGHPAQQPFVITLNRGQTYQLRNEAGQPADLTGTRILASKPVAVFGSHRCANVQSVSQFFCDTVVEELLPVSSWGSDFFIVPLATRKADTVRVLSGADNNLVTVATTSGSQNFILPKAGFKDLVLDQPTRIASRGPAMVMQFANSSDADHVIDADPFMAMIQPSSTWLSQYRLCTPSASEFGDNYLNLVGASASVLDLTTINGVALGAWNPAHVTKGALPGGAAFARVRIDSGNSYQIIGRGPLGLTAYGFSEFDSYGYPGGMRFPGSSPPVMSCPGDITVNCRAVPGTSGCLAPVPDLARRVDVFDDCGAPGGVTITQTPEPGTLLKPGTYAITLVATDGDGDTAQCVIQLTVETGWAEQQFGITVAGNPSLEATLWGANADPDVDGLSNAMEEALGTSPNQKTSLASVLSLSLDNNAWGSFPIVTLPRLNGGNGPTLELEEVPALDGSPWLGGPDVFEELPERNTPLAGGKHEIATFRVRQPRSPGAVNALFLRLKVIP